MNGNGAPMPAAAVLKPPAEQAGTGQPGLVRTALASLDDAGVRWCLLRGGSDTLTRAGDVDILIASADLARAARVIEAHRFIRLRSHGRGTHAFFLGLDPVTGAWVELDLVTEIAYGRNFEVRTAAADECLNRRQPRHGVWELAPVDEFWALLLHCLLDKPAFPPHRRRRLTRLVVTASVDSPLVRAFPPGADCAALLARVREQAWPAVRAQRRTVWSAWCRAHPIAVARRSLASVAWRLVERPLQAWSRRGVSVALVGPDGAGKSTLAAGIESAFYFPVRRIYMGLWRSNDQQYGVGARVRRILLRPFVVWRRYLAGVHHRMRGRLVVFDRYIYDALLPPRGSLRWLKRPYLQFLSRICPAPNLVLLLDAPGSVMHIRSGEYDPDHLEAERRTYQLLSQRLPHVRRLDASQPPQAVLADALAVIWQQYVARVTR